MALTNSYGLHCEMCDVWTHILRTNPLSPPYMLTLTYAKAIFRAYK